MKNIDRVRTVLCRACIGITQDDQHVYLCLEDEKTKAEQKEKLHLAHYTHVADDACWRADELVCPLRLEKRGPR